MLGGATGVARHGESSREHVRSAGDGRETTGSGLRVAHPDGSRRTWDGGLRRGRRSRGTADGARLLLRLLLTMDGRGGGRLRVALKTGGTSETEHGGVGGGGRSSGESSLLRREVESVERRLPLLRVDRSLASELERLRHAALRVGNTVGLRLHRGNRD